MKIRNTFIIFLVSGFWHGANWTFIVWGALNAVYFLPLMLMKKNRKNTDIVAQERLLPSFKEILQIGATFFITLIAWIFFRAESIQDAFRYITTLFSMSLFSTPEIYPSKIITLIVLFVVIEWLQREKQHALQFDAGFLPKILRWGIYYGIGALIIEFGGIQQQFIYFQF